MIEFSSNPLAIKGKGRDVRHFIIDACNATVELDGTLSFEDDWTPVKGTKLGYIIPTEEYAVIDTDKEEVILPVYYKQINDIYAGDFKKLSKLYKVDFRLFAYESTLKIARNLEVANGNITLNELVNVPFTLQKNWYLIPEFGWDPILTSRAFGCRPCQMSNELDEKQSEFLKAVAEAQSQRYIDKCPCCGEDEMLTAAGKTDGWPSQLAGVYVCHHCGCLTNMELNLPLSKWAVFKQENMETFLLSQKFTPSDMP